MFYVSKGGLKRGECAQIARGTVVIHRLLQLWKGLREGPDLKRDESGHGRATFKGLRPAPGPV